MLSGQMYKVTIEYQAGNYRMVRRVFCARFLGEVRENSEYSFSGRPAFGTTEVPKAYVQKIEVMPINTKPYAPRPLKIGER